MATKQDELIRRLEDPSALEHFYQTKPREFLSWLEVANAQLPNSETLSVWNARIGYSNRAMERNNLSGAFAVILIALLAGLFMKGHALPMIDDAWYLERFAPVIAIGSMTAYFLWSRPVTRLGALSVLGVAICIIVLMFLPNSTGSATVKMSLLYMPMVLLSLLGLTLAGEDWRSTKARVAFVRFLGEVSIYALVILLGGVVLTLLSLSLFSAVGLNLNDFYFEYVVVFGLSAAPAVATYLFDSMLGGESGLATHISRIFAPLFLVTVCAYLLVIIIQGSNPYEDRDFLITINGLLLVVLAITVYSVSGVEVAAQNRIVGVINISLVAVTLVINIWALSAILFRWAEYGLTPNRVAVTGANVLIFVHLVLILRTHIMQLWRGRSSEQLLGTVARYLPIYTIWSVLMAFGLPLAFQFA